MDNLTIIDEEPLDESHGWDPQHRPLPQLLNYGIICVDKPPGPSSHEVVAWVRRILEITKAGHSGTLDPPVTGLLPVGVGDATKVLETLLMGPKEYYAIAKLHGSVDIDRLGNVIKEFTGTIYQKPPQRSAVKRETRSRTIYSLDLVENKDKLLLLRILCQAGTYVRKLVYDIGEVLGDGATMIELRRTQVNHLKESDGLVRLHELMDAVHLWKNKHEEEKIRRLIKPVEHAVEHMKVVVIRDSAIDAICHGAQLAIPGVLRISKDIINGDKVCLYSTKGEIVALGEAVLNTNDLVEKEKGIAFKTKRVIMKAGTYPRMWKPRDEDKVQ